MIQKAIRLKTKDETREDFVDICRDIFTKYGYHKTTIDDISLAVGKGKSTLYYYFTGKDEMYKAVIELELSELKKKLLREVEKTNDPQSKIKAYILTRMDSISQYKVLYSAIKEQSKSRFAESDNIHHVFKIQEIQILTKILEEGVQEGYFTIQEPEFAAIGLIAAIRGIELKLFSNIRKPGFDQTLDNLIEIVLYGVIK
ncbi:MAG: TetR/AcrR family transcriptional regulator [Bacteroidetes bacterium]|nr:TetR/AcrR family transcriptional regulator [Bacteroidota bacterium]